MKLQCKCGETIHDNSDYQENKAYFVPDETWESMLEEIDSGSSPWDATRKVKRNIYQCYNCSRIYLETKSGHYSSFTPDKEVKFGILKNT
jgi:hypothetical protein